eukprot:g30068.t1
MCPRLRVETASTQTGPFKVSLEMSKYDDPIILEMLNPRVRAPSAANVNNIAEQGQPQPVVTPAQRVPESSTEVRVREAKTASPPSGHDTGKDEKKQEKAASPPIPMSPGANYVSASIGREAAIPSQSQAFNWKSLKKEERDAKLNSLFEAAENNNRAEMARILETENKRTPPTEPSKVEQFNVVHKTRGTIPHARRLFGVEFEREELSMELLKGVADSNLPDVKKALEGRAAVKKALEGRLVLSHLRKTGWKRSCFQGLHNLEKKIKKLKDELQKKVCELQEQIQYCEAEEEQKKLSSEPVTIVVDHGKIKKKKELENEKNLLLKRYTCNICKEFLDEAVKTACGRYCSDCWQDWARNKYWEKKKTNKKPLCPNPRENCSCIEQNTCKPMTRARMLINGMNVFKACEFGCDESKGAKKEICTLLEYKEHRDKCDRNPKNTKSTGIIATENKEQMDRGQPDKAPPIVMMWPDLYLQDAKGQDALYKAAGLGDIDLVKTLIEAVTKADPKKRAELLGNRFSCRRWISLPRVSEGSGRTPLMVATRGGHLQVVGRLLKEQADLRASTQAGSCALSYAVQNKDWLMTHMLLVAGSDITKENLNFLKIDKKTQLPADFTQLLNAAEEMAPLVVAIRSNYRIEEVAEKLSSASYEAVNDSLLDGTTPLLAGCSKPSEEEAKRLVEKLVEKNADVNKSGFVNNSPLLEACEKGHTNVAKILLDAGSRWNEQDVEGRTPLSVLSWRSQDATELIEYLHMVHKIHLIRENNLDLDKHGAKSILGRGYFGVVVECNYTNQPHAVKFPKTTKNQAIRRLTANMRPSSEDAQFSVSERTPAQNDGKNRESEEKRQIYSEFLREALICTRVGSKKNVVPFCGANLSLDKEPFLVFEKMAGNSVYKHLGCDKNEPASPEWCKKYHPWIYRALPQAASGLLALHIEGVVHRDVRAENFLVGASYNEERKSDDRLEETKDRSDGRSMRQNVYISDFGLSQMLKKMEGTEKFKEEGEMPPHSPLHIPWMWTAPEILKDTRKFSKKSDVYMFGMFMYECFERKHGPPFSCQEPSPGLTPEEQDRERVDQIKTLREKIVEAKYRPQFFVTPEKYQKLIEQCWDADPAKRPDSETLQKALANLEKEMEDEPA